MNVKIWKNRVTKRRTRITPLTMVWLQHTDLFEGVKVIITHWVFALEVKWILAPAIEQ